MSLMNQYEYTNVYNVLLNLMQQSGVPQQAANVIAQEFHPSNGRQRPMLEQIYVQNVPHHIRSLPQGVPGEKIVEILRPCIQTWVNSILSQQQSPQMGGGYGYPQQSMQSGWVPQQQQPQMGWGQQQQTGPQRSAYDSDIGGPSMQTAQPQAAPAQSQAPQHPFDLRTGSTPHKDTPMETFTQNSDNPVEMLAAPLEDVTDVFTSPEFDRMFDNYRIFQTTNRSSNFINHLKADMRRTFNTDFDVFRHVWGHIPGSLRRGYWSFSFTYERLVTIPMPTKKYLEIHDAVVEAMDKDSWSFETALTALGQFSKNDWAVMDKLLTKEINERLQRIVRTRKHIEEAPIIEDLEDALDLLTPEFAEKTTVGKDPKFETIIREDILQDIVDAFFIPTSDRSRHAGEGDQAKIIPPRMVVHADDTNLGDFLNADGIDFYEPDHPTISKFDVALFEHSDVKALISKLMSKYTVLRIPTTLIVTNFHPKYPLKTPYPIDTTMMGDPSTSSIAKIVHDDFLNASRMFTIPLGTPPQVKMRQVIPILTMDGYHYIEPVNETIGF